MTKEYTQHLQKIEIELERWLPQEPDSAWKEKVFGEIGKKIDTESVKALLTPARELLFRGGKRWRPLLMTLICETLGGGDTAVPLSPVIEFSHNATLIHDDIEDESDERRGKPAIHKMFGVDVAINSGSFFYFLASSCIESFNGMPEKKDLIYKLWMDCMRRIHLGQSMDINWHRDISFVPTIDDYFSMCTMKTGSFARLAAQLGVYAAGASCETAKVLGDAADTMGIGFQILDDVKNLTTGIKGKKRGDDVAEGKKSFPVIMFLNRYPEKQDRIFYFFHEAKTYGTAAPEVEELIKTLSLSGVFEEAEEKGKSLIKQAKDVFLSNEYACRPVNENGHVLLDGFINLIS